MEGKYSRRHPMGQCVEAGEVVVCAESRMELMFPQLGVGVAEIGMEQPARLQGRAPEESWGPVRRSVDFVPMSLGVLWEECSRAEAVSRLFATEQEGSEDHCGRGGM